jgi:hypothetical protein
MAAFHKKMPVGSFCLPNANVMAKLLEKRAFI